MSRKRRAKRPCKRTRSVIVAFRMEEDAARRLDALVSLSGLTKQDYIERRLLDESRDRHPELAHREITLAMDAGDLPRAHPCKAGKADAGRGSRMDRPSRGGGVRRALVRVCRQRRQRGDEGYSEALSLHAICAVSSTSSSTQRTQLIGLARANCPGCSHEQAPRRYANIWAING